MKVLSARPIGARLRISNRAVLRPRKFFAYLSIGTLLLSILTVAPAAPVKATAVVTNGKCTATLNDTTGVSIQEVNGFCQLTFTSTTASYSWTAPEDVPSVQVFLVGGGGGGGGAGYRNTGFGGGGGGGAAGNVLLNSSVAISANTSISVSIGSGGSGGAIGVSGNWNGFSGTDGNSTVFGAITAAGGRAGFGGARPNGDETSSGAYTSGGTQCNPADRAWIDGAGGKGGTNSNFSGGTGRVNNCWSSFGAGGGGAGTTSSGGNALGTGNDFGSGGTGTSYFGSTYASGGSGGRGGDSLNIQNSTNASNNTGNGGKGGDGQTAAGNGKVGGAGGSGIAIVRWAIPVSQADQECSQTLGSTTDVAIAKVGNDCVVSFLSGNNSWTAPSAISNIRLLAVGGGGAGGGGIGGGGGAGEFVEYTAATPLAVTSGSTYSITVGAGGVPTPWSAGSGAGGAGANSIFGSVTAYGGGGGGLSNESGRTPTPPQTSGQFSGSRGGNGYIDRTASNTPTNTSNPTRARSAGGLGSGDEGSGAAAAGGGGAGATGATGSSSSGGNGGAGLQSSITGNDLFYAAGGGGGVNGASSPGFTSSVFTGSTGAGGSSIGGHGGAKATNSGSDSYGNRGDGTNGTVNSFGTAGATNTGSGGGGASNWTSGAAGGSGVVVVRYTLATQSALTLTSTSAYLGETLALTTGGGSGSGSVSYAVTTPGTAGCSVSGPTLSYSSIGTCTVTATKAAADGYASTSTSATQVTIASPLLAYESFDGMSTPVSGKSGTGSQGFTGNWVTVTSKNDAGTTSTSPQSVSTTNTPALLGRSYPAGVGFALPNTNQAIELNSGGGGPHFRQVARALTSSISLNANRTYYMSLLTNGDNHLMAGLLTGLPADATDTSKSSLLAGFVPDPGPDGQFGIDYGKANRSAACPDNGIDACFAIADYTAVSTISGGVAGSQRVNGSTYPNFSLVKITASASGNDTIQIKGFPYGTSIPTNDSAISWDATYSADISDTFTHLTVQMAGLGFSYLDEVRLGTSYASVVNPVTTNVLTMNPNFAGATITTQTVSSGVDVVVANPTRTGFVFNGWNTNADGTSGTDYTSTQAINVTSDTTLFAKWRNYNVTFKAGTFGSGADQVFEKTYDVDYTMPASAAANEYFSRTGYTIVGWSTSINGTSISQELGSTYSLNQDRTFYPVWEGTQRNDYALNFTGLSGSYATTSAATIIPTTTAFTIQAWVKPSSNTINNTNAVIFSQGSSTGRFFLKRNQLGDLLLSTRGTNSEFLCGNIPANFWSHVAVSFTPSTTNCFVNGVQQNTASGTSTLGNTFAVGGFSGALSAQDTSWIGQIDEVRVYSNARTASQILTDAHTYGSVNDTNLIAYYDFNDGTGSTALNRKIGAASTTNLTLNGSPTWVNLATTTTSSGVSRVTFERTYLNSYGGWETPVGTTSFRALIVGGGGGGGDSEPSFTGGGGGAGGYFATDSLTASGKLSVTVGAGGPGGRTTAAQGSAGGTSSIGTLKVGGGGGGNGYQYPTVAAAGAGIGGADFVSSGSGGGGRSRGFGDNDAKLGGAGGGVAASGVVFQGNTYTGTAGAAGENAYSDQGSGGVGGAITQASRTSSITGSSVVYAKGGVFQAWENGANPARPFTYGSGGSANYTYGAVEAASNFGGTGAPGVVIISWVDNKIVTFNSNYVGGASDTTQSVVSGEATALTANGFERTGFIFSGWAENADGTGSTYTNSQSVTLSTDTTLYAKWTPIQTVDSSMELSGTAGQYGQVSGGQIIPATGAFTVQAWLKPDADVSSNGNAVLISQGTGSNRFYIKRNSVGSLIYFRDGLSNVEANCGNSPANTWSHVAITFNSGTLTCFLNGVQQSTLTANASINPGFAIGDYSADLGKQVNTWKGSIDEVRVYNQAHSAGVIAEDAHFYPGLVDSTLVAYYDFNEGSGTTIFNKKAAAASTTNLTLSGSPTFADVAETSTVNGKTVRIFKRTYLNNAGGWTVPGDATNIDVLAVGGGGAGGSAIDGTSGGGGGGRVLTQTNVPLSGALAIQVGQGGSPRLTTESALPGRNGGITSITPASGTAITALGGSGGATSNRFDGVGSPATSGYNGGGGAQWAATTTNGSLGNGGFAGGNAQGSSTDSNAQLGGGGGGAGAIGSSGSGGGGGGAGVANAYATGSNIFYGGGGGGGKRSPGTAGAGGSSVGGSGGANTSGNSAIANSGGGGGGAGSFSGTVIGGSGAAGIVVVRYGLENYTVTFNKGTVPGATGDDQTSTKSQGTDLTLPNSVTANTYFTKTGYTVTSWSTSADGSTSDFEFGASYTAEAAVTLYPVWTPNTYTVTYNSNGGSAVTAGSFTSGGSIDSAPADPSRTGFTFDGWAATNGGSAITFPYSPGVTNNITLFARWVGVPFLSYNASDLNSYDSSGTSVTDLSPGGINSTTINNLAYSNSAYAWNFPGGDRATAPYVDVPNLSSNNFANGFTVDFEANFGAEKNSWERIIDFGESGSENDNIFIGRSGTNSNLHMRIYNGSTLNGCFFIDAVNENVMTRYTIVKTSQNCILYTRGSTYTVGGTWMAMPNLTLTDNFIGRSNWGGDSSFEGQIRSIRMYSNPMSLAEVSAITYRTVTFDSNGGTATGVASATTSGKLRLTTAPTRAGYSFTGWFDASSGGNLVGAASAEYTPTTSSTVLAQWSANKYSYNANTGSNPPADQTFAGTTLTAASGSGVTAPTGYSFGGWCTTQPSVGASCGGTSYAAGEDLPAPSSATVTLFAVWTGNSNTVTYDSNGGTTVTDGSFSSGGSIASAPTEPTRSGFTFDGWSATNGGAIVDFPYSPGVVTGITLFAKWSANKYSYNANTGSNPPADQTFAGTTLTAAYGSGVTAPTGHSFSGWCTTQPSVGASCGGTSYAAGDNLPDPSSATVTLFAVWTLNTYTVTFNKGTVSGADGVNQTATKSHFDSLTLPNSATANTYFTKTGHTVTAWSATADGSTSDFALGASYTTESATTLYPVWTLNTYTVTFNKGTVSGATGSNQTETKSHFASLTLPDSVTANTYFTKTGYTVTSWSTSADGSTSDFAFGASYATEAALTLYPVWTLNTYTVTYNKGTASGATGIDQTATKSHFTSLTLLDSVSANDLFNKTGYTVTGWSTTADGSTSDFALGASYTAEAAVTLYPVWTLNTYTVTFNKGTVSGATGSNQTATKSHFTSMTLPDSATANNYFTKNGYTVTAWSTTANGSTIDFALGANYATESALTLYPVWTAVGYTYTFDSNSGSSVAGGGFEIGDTIAKPTDPTKANKYFGGWSTSETSDQGNAADKVNTWPYTPSAASVTFYAIWFDDQALALAGTNRVSARNSASDLIPIRGSYTWEAWVYPTGNSVAGTTQRWTVLDNLDDANNFGRSWLYVIDAGSGPLVSAGYFTTDGTGVNLQTNSNTLSYNTWQHIAVTVDRPNIVNSTMVMRVFIDGSLIKTHTITNMGVTRNLNSRGFSIGDNEDDPNQQFKGRIDQVKVWDGALTGAELGASLNSYSTGGVDNTLLAHYGFNDLSASPALGDTIDNLASESSAYDLRIFGNFAADVTANMSPFQNSYSITYSANNATSGSVAGESGLMPFAEITLPSDGDLVRTGYTFGGWNTNSAGTGTNYLSGSSYQMLYGNKTLYAKWNEITYDVTYDTNSSFGTNSPTSGSPSRLTDTYRSTGGALTVPVRGTMLKAGYVFKGWTENQNGTGTVYVTDGVNNVRYTPTSNITLYAKWDAGTYAVTYNSNSGGTAPSAGSYITGGTAVTLPGQGSMSRAGYDFNGWSTSINDVSTKISTATIRPSEAVTLYALWTPIEYDITYCENSTCTEAFDGDVPVDSDTYNIGDDVVVKANTGALVRTGYSFGGWTVNSNGSGTGLQSGQTYEVQSSDIRFYPKWNANTYTISYNTNGATGTQADSSTSYTTGNSAVTLSGPGSMAKTGYNFVGWSTIPTGTGQTTATTTSDVTMFAIWELKSIGYQYLFGRVKIGGSFVDVDDNFISPKPSPLSASANFGTSVTLSSTMDQTYSDSGSNFEFFGWKDNIIGQVFDTGTSYLISSETALQFTAQWVQVLEVRYAFNGGTPDGDDTIGEAECRSSGNTCTVGQEITTNSAPTRLGYTFNGWKDQAGLSVPTGQAYNVTADSYLFYAQWTANNYEMSFDTDGGNANPATLTRTIGQTFLFPSAGIRTGYDFNGWVVRGTSTPTYGVGTSFVSGSTGIDFVASWTPKKYTVSYNWNGGVGTPTSPVEYTVDQPLAITLPTGTGYTRDGFIFDGWATTDNGTAVGATFRPTDNTLLFARWINGAYTLTYDNFNASPNTSASVTRLTSTTLPTPVRAGFTFDGWYEDANYTLLYGIGGASVTPTSSKILTAKWTQNSLAGINPAHLNSLVTLNIASGSSASWSGDHQQSGTGAEINIPANALPAGTVVKVSFVEDLTRPAGKIPGNNTYFTSVVVHWLSGTGSSATVPTAIAGKPVELTLTNPAIIAGAKVFSIIAGEVTEVATATVDGEVVISFYDDPEFVVAATKPGSPTAVTATNNQNAQSLVSWNAPLGNGGSAVTDYTVTSNPAGFGCTTSGTSCQVTGLTNDTPYTFTVTATNANGTSAPSSPSAAITPRLAITYSVTFNSTGGSPVGNGSFVEDTSLSAPTDPTRSGYNFIGWATVEGDESTIVSFPYSPANANLTLYAMWRVNNPAQAPDNSGNNGAVITPISNTASATPKATAKPTAKAASSARPTVAASPAATPEPTASTPEVPTATSKPTSPTDVTNEAASGSGYDNLILGLMALLGAFLTAGLGVFAARVMRKSKM